MARISSSHLQFCHIFNFMTLFIGFSIGVSVSFYFKSSDSMLQIGSAELSLSSSDSLVRKAPETSGSVEIDMKPKLLHNMDDNELFWKASFAPRIKELPFKNVPKVAFMFLTKGDMPFASLWEIFFKGHEGHYSICVHPQPSFIDSYPEDSVFFGRRIRSKSVQWGKSTMINAERRLLASALLDLTNERFVLLSESCIPLFNFTTIYNYLINAEKSFVESFDEPGRYGRERYNPNMLPTVSLSEWRKGSQWFAVDRETALEIVSDSKYYPIFRRHCQAPCYMDEHYIPTMVNILFPEKNSNRTITWVDWSRRGAHPGEFGENDVSDEFLNRIRFNRNCSYNGNANKTCFLFARKFLPDTLQSLLKSVPLLMNGTTYAQISNVHEG